MPKIEEKPKYYGYKIDLEDKGMLHTSKPWSGIGLIQFYEGRSARLYARDDARQQKDQEAADVKKFQSENFKNSYYLKDIRPFQCMRQAEFGVFQIARGGEFDYHFVFGQVPNEDHVTMWEYRIRCGPRFCGEIDPNTLECGHGYIIWGGKESPPGWRLAKGWTEANPFLIETPDTEKKMWYLYDEENKTMVSSPQCKIARPVYTEAGLALKLNCTPPALPNIPQDLEEEEILGEMVLEEPVEEMEID